MRGIIPWKRGERGVQRRGTDEWFDSFLENPFRALSEPWGGDENVMLQPTVDVNEDKKNVYVRSEIPGLKKEDLDITYQNGLLTISGEKTEEQKEEKKGWRRKECRYGSFQRTIPVGENVKWDAAKANYRNGVLSVTLPKAEEEKKQKKIDVAVE